MQKMDKGSKLAMDRKKFFGVLCCATLSLYASVQPITVRSSRSSDVLTSFSVHENLKNSCIPN